MATLDPGQSYRVIFEGIADEDGHLDLPNGAYLTSSQVSDATAVEDGSRVVALRAPRRARSIRVEDDLWLAALRKADEHGEVLSEEIRKFLKRYLRRA